MFNRNGSNNGPSDGTGDGIVHINGNGRQPDAAPASSTGQAIVGEQAAQDDRLFGRDVEREEILAVGLAQDQDFLPGFRIFRDFVDAIVHIRFPVQGSFWGSWSV